MRIGTNPEKINPKHLVHKHHRVIIPVYIPNLEDEYFKNALEVLKVCLDSLLATINVAHTNITIINNASCEKVSELLEEYFRNGKIDKFVFYKENRGKVETVLSEAMSSWEEYITIADADVYFRPGWIEETFKIFDFFPKAGVVAPLPSPHLYHYYNAPCVCENFFLRNLHYAHIVEKDVLIEFEKSVGSNLMKNCYEKQYFIQSKTGYKAIVGAGHFVATYKNIFHKLDKSRKVTYVFKNGLEAYHLDNLFEKYGLWRLSTCKPYVYHMGNSIISKYCCSKQIEKTNQTIHIPSYTVRQFCLKNELLYICRLFFKIIRK